MDQLADTDLFRQEAFVGGAWLAAAEGNWDTIAVLNPATGHEIGVIPDLGESGATQAVEAAEGAFASWRALSGKDRAIILRRWFDLITEHTGDLARIMTVEQGKPLAESRGEIAYAASFVEWFAEEGKRLYGDVMSHPQSDKRIVVLKQPIGVVAAITPWNFPAAMITRKTAPALAAGCPVVVKPSELTPYSALALAVLAERAGVPPGVFNVVTGAPREIGRVLTSHGAVKKLAFTGSTAVGRKLMRQAAETVKKVSLELGGNAPFIVFADADLDAAVAGLMVCKFRNSGQTCVCANRILVEDKIYDAFVTKLLAAVSALQCGDGLEAGVSQGPLINKAAMDKVTRLVEGAISAGATCLAGGIAHSISNTLGGEFFEPTVLSGVTPDMDIFSQEIFGPVASLIRFSGEDEAVTIANDTPYGLAAYVYTRDLGRTVRVCEALEYGMVAVNEGILSNEVAPFGGMKESGIGREGSKYGLEEYVEIKYLCLGGLAD